MIKTIRELRDFIADNCDFSQPLRVVAEDVGKKAGKHSTVYVDESYPTRMSTSPGRYDNRGVIEFAHYPDIEVLMPEAAIEALDSLLEQNPKATVGWIYFFYYPLTYKGFFGKITKIKDCLLDTHEVQDIYMMDEYPNTLVIKAPYAVGSFDM